ncbi:MAG: GyrI-like domain-containing protein [Hungatella hathewayi]|nr:MULTISPECIES: GyrI-like domain-containing protein [Hungatella]MBS5073096.1 GyrI-like domain-containing protein [Hungatella hathewayi]
MPFDYKKEYKALYLPKEMPSIVEVPSMQYAAVRGHGDPNEPDGEYGRAVAVLYGISYTIKMSYKGSRKVDGFFEYVVPPLEGFWWMEGGAPGVDYRNKSGFNWISIIRVPEFVTEEVFAWAKEEAQRKKGIDTSLAELITVSEGLCVQCLHIGSYNEEPATVAKMDRYLLEQGYENDISDLRRHHEIYLSDPRKVSPERMKTVIRHPVRPKID